MSQITCKKSRYRRNMPLTILIKQINIAFKKVHAQTIMKLQLSYPQCIPFHSNIPATLTERLLLQAPVYKLRLSVQGPPDQHCPESSSPLSLQTL